MAPRASSHDLQRFDGGRNGVRVVDVEHVPGVGQHDLSAAKLAGERRVPSGPVDVGVTQRGEHDHGDIRKRLFGT